MSANKEIWKNVSGSDGHYQVSNMGGYKKDGRAIPKTFNKGYVSACPKINGEYRSGGLHRFVAMAFLGIPKRGMVVNHKNGIKDDNRVENLEWCTHKENSHHAWRTGLHAKGLIAMKETAKKKREEAAKMAKMAPPRPTVACIVYTETEAAGKLGVSVAELSDMVKRREIPAYKLSRKELRFLIKEVDALALSKEAR